MGNEGKDLNVIIGGELVKLTIELTAKKDIKGLIVGFVLKNDKGLVVLGDNTFNKIESKEEETITSGEILSGFCIYYAVTTCRTIFDYFINSRREYRYTRYYIGKMTQY